MLSLHLIPLHNEFTLLLALTVHCFNANKVDFTAQHLLPRKIVKIN